MNSFDELIEKFTEELSKVNFKHPDHNDQNVSRILDFSVRKIFELVQYRTLFLEYYIPAASEAIVKSKIEYNNSKYKNQLNITDEDFNSNTYETIRLGFIGLFHKYESFISELIFSLDNLICDNEITRKNSIETYAEKEFKFKIRDWKLTPLIEYINWINNCCKHKDGFPIKKPFPLHVIKLKSQYPENKRLKLTREDFEKYSAGLQNFYPIITQVTYLIGMYKTMFEEKDSLYKNNKQYKLKYDEAQKIVYNQILIAIGFINRYRENYNKRLEAI